jgi:hypothetical protein
MLHTAIFATMMIMYMPVLATQFRAVIVDLMTVTANRSGDDKSDSRYNNDSYSNDKDDSSYETNIVTISAYIQ